MTKKQFGDLFERALNLAAGNAERQRGKPVPRTFLIELHAPRSAGRVLSVEEALDHLYLGDDRFYRVIDVAVKQVSLRESVVFARVSGHTPAEFDKTWDPSGLGPFKQILAAKIDDRSNA